MASYFTSTFRCLFLLAITATIVSAIFTCHLCGGIENRHFPDCANQPMMNDDHQSQPTSALEQSATSQSISASLVTDNESRAISFSTTVKLGAVQSSTAQGGDFAFQCICGRATRSARGLGLHQKACAIFKTTTTQEAHGLQPMTAVDQSTSLTGEPLCRALPGSRRAGLRSSGQLSQSAKQYTQPAHSSQPITSLPSDTTLAYQHVQPIMSLDTTSAAQPSTKQLITTQLGNTQRGTTHCICNRPCAGLRGLTSHQRSCSVYNLHISGYGLSSQENPEVNKSISVNSKTSRNNSLHDYININRIDNQDSSKLESSNSRSPRRVPSSSPLTDCSPAPLSSEGNGLTNPSSRVSIESYPSVRPVLHSPGTIPPTSHRTSERFPLLAGVKLPTNPADWTLANTFFHSSDIFKYATGKIVDLDGAVRVFNSTVYGYFSKNCGLVGKKVDDPGHTVLADKYRDWSRTRMKRALMKLKHSGPIGVNSALHIEIRFLAGRIRESLNERVNSRQIKDRDFNSRFWPTCKRAFETVISMAPTFNLAECFDYFKNILSISSNSLDLFMIPDWFVKIPPPSIPFNLAPPSYKEIASLINKARGSASANPLDQISIITLKRCPILRTILHNIIANCWVSGYTPKPWRAGVTVLVFKKGDPSKVDNFRPITLQSAPYKIYSAFIRNRLQAFLDQNNFHNNSVQKGFAHGQDGVMEHTELCDFMIRDAKRQHRGLCAILLDLRNAFGEVQHNLIRSSLRYHHVPEDFISIFDSIYHQFKITISCLGGTTEAIVVNKGVLQGDPSSPLFFNICFNSLMKIIETPAYSKMGYTWGNSPSQRCCWMQYADDALIVARSQKTAQGLLKLFEAWCSWAKMDIRLDKCVSFGMAMNQSRYQQFLPALALSRGVIPAVPLGSHFKYLGRIFDFNMKDEIPKQNIEEKMNKLLKTITDLNIKPQTKLKIFSMFVPSQILFDLKLYSFTSTFISSIIDRLCTVHIRKWLECPVSSCVDEWMSSPTKFCGLGIPTFSNRAENLLLSKRHALMKSKNITIRELWSSTNRSNIKIDSRIMETDFNSAAKSLKVEQDMHSVSHFLGLKSQGLNAKMVSEWILPKNINIWKSAIEQLPSFVFNFVRKAMMNQLPTLKNLKMWGCAATDLCPRCGLVQSNKHVLSNCNCPEALARYLDRHNRVLKLITNWIKSSLSSPADLYCDLALTGVKHISDLFVGCRPDLAIVSSNRIAVCELTVCHETNLRASRDYKINKYANIASSRSSLVSQLPVRVYTIEVSTLGFVAAEPNFFKDCALPYLNNSILTEIIKTTALASHDIYGKR
jgi:hypothetical protein